LRFGNSWKAEQVDTWLHETLPGVFDYLTDMFEHDYPWHLLKATRCHLQLHREIPDGYDLLSVKGNKCKRWQESKLFFGMFKSFNVFYYTYFHLVTRPRILVIVELLKPPATSSKKGKGKLKWTSGIAFRYILLKVTEKSYCEAKPDSDDESVFEYNTQSKKRKFSSPHSSTGK
jgi:hypothetical protein